MTTHQFEFTNAGNRFAGTLLTPESGPAPAALLVSGSGPLDRDSNTKRLRIDAMHQVAAHLAAIGVASLRYDKRGVGDNVADAGAALEALRARPEIDADRIVVIGHSEGALIASELAAADTKLAGAVLLAGATQTGEQVLRWQAQHVSASLPAPARLILKLLRKDVLTMQDKRLAQLKQSTGDVARIQLVKVNVKWFREFLAYDPTDALRRISNPLLAITGAKDIQVDPDDIGRMEDLVAGPFTGMVMPDPTHLLRTTPGEDATLRTYKKQAKRPVDPGLLEAVGRWVTDVVTRTEGAPHRTP